VTDPLLPPGSNRCLCDGCGRYFGGVRAFDRHQTARRDGTTICHDPATRKLVFDGRYWAQPRPLFLGDGVPRLRTKPPTPVS
jgi:hypothetical protein